MATRTDPEMRRRFFQAHLQGQSYAEIAAEEGVSKECVRYWCRRQKRGESVISHYPGPAPGLLQRFDPLVRYVLLKLRLQHPRWGPSRLLWGMRKRPSLAQLRLPHPSQIGRYLHQFERFRRKPRPQPKRERPEPPQYTSQRWQIDFKLGIPLRDGSLVNLFTACDPYAGACIGAELFPAGQVGQAPKRVVEEQVRSFLRRCFARWQVLPAELQTDGESTLVANRGPNDFPTPFTRWLEGLGIHHLVTRPHRPTDNAEVERMHRTVNDFALQGGCLTDLDTVNAHLQEAIMFLVYELPSHAKHCAGLAPIQAHPELDSPARPFQPEWELAHFNLVRVDAFLAPSSWERRVGKTGQINLGSQVYSVGRTHARKLVTIRYEPLTREFVVFGQLEGTGKDDDELKRLAIRGNEVDDLIGYSFPALAPGPQQLPLPLAWKVAPEEVNC